MRGGRKRVALGCAVLLGVMTGSAQAAKALPCADWISSSGDDAPLVGHLIGTSTVTYEIQVKPGGIGATVTETFEVGQYEMSNGEILRIDCRTYTEYKV